MYEWLFQVLIDPQQHSRHNINYQILYVFIWMNLSAHCENCNRSNAGGARPSRAIREVPVYSSSSSKSYRTQHAQQRTAGTYKKNTHMANMHVCVDDIHNSPYSSPLVAHLYCSRGIMS